jgi:uncharacterized protein YheU (UPF0270 family)
MSEHMPSDATVSAALQECIDSQRAILSEYITTIDGLIAIVIGHESSAALRSEKGAVPGACVPVLALMLQALGSSSHTLVRLSDRPGLHTRDCYSVARSIVELAANICYVIASGPAAAERATRHARQKAFRDLTRESKVGGTVITLTFEGAPDPSVIEGLEEDIEEFSTRGGREKGWVDASIDDKIAAVEKLSARGMATLHWARFAIYRHSSEVLHGTFFSALHFFGLTTASGGPRSVEEMREALGQQHMLVLMSATLALSAVVQSFHAAYGFRAAQERDDRLMRALRAIPLFRENKPIAP